MSYSEHIQEKVVLKYEKQPIMGEPSQFLTVTIEGTSHLVNALAEHVRTPMKRLPL